MPFLGYTPDNTFHTLSKQTITGDGGTTDDPQYEIGSSEIILTEIKQ